jgi:hypothetical protein
MDDNGIRTRMSIRGISNYDKQRDGRKIKKKKYRGKERK